jgi:hypothetical protein
LIGQVRPGWISGADARARGELFAGVELDVQLAQNFPVPVFGQRLGRCRGQSVQIEIIRVFVRRKEPLRLLYRDILGTIQKSRISSSFDKGI